MQLSLKAESLIAFCFLWWFLFLLLLPLLLLLKVSFRFFVSIIFCCCCWMVLFHIMRAYLVGIHAAILTHYLRIFGNETQIKSTETITAMMAAAASASASKNTRTMFTEKRKNDARDILLFSKSSRSYRFLDFQLIHWNDDVCTWIDFPISWWSYDTNYMFLVQRKRSRERK